MIEVLTPRRTIKVQRAYIPEVRAVLPDGDTCVVVDSYGRLFTVSLAAGKQVPGGRGRTGGVDLTSLTPDGGLMATTSRRAYGDHGIRIFDTADWSVITELAGHTRPIQAISAAGQVVVTAAMDGTRVWDLDTGSCRFVLPGTEEVLWIAVTSDQRRVVTMAWDRSVVVWDLRQGTPIRTLRGADREVPALRSPASDRGVWIRTVLVDSARDRVLVADGHLCAGGLEGDRRLARWGTIPRDEGVTMIPSRDRVHTCLAAVNSADGTVAVDYGGRAFILDRGGRPLAVMGPEPGPSWAPMSTMAFTSDGRLVSSLPGAFAAVEVWPALSELTG